MVDRETGELEGPRFGPAGYRSQYRVLLAGRLRVPGKDSRGV